jgi:hypothetical protein
MGIAPFGKALGRLREAFPLSVEEGFSPPLRLVT